MTTRFPSLIDLSNEHRTALVSTLNTALADTLALQLMTKQAHWNLRGRQFIATHEFLDEVAEHLRIFGDDIAERASALGGYARGTVAMAANETGIPEYDESANAAPAHIKVLTERFATYTSRIRNAISSVERIGEPATEDLLTEVLRDTEKDMWLLHSHLLD